MRSIGIEWQVPTFKEASQTVYDLPLGGLMVKKGYRLPFNTFNTD